jgi:hypothetical protein
VRHNAKQSLDNHQLSAMVHFVFLGPDEHLKAGFQPPARLANMFGQQ